MDPLGASHERFYRLLIRLYPAAFRARFGEEMVRLFGDQLRSERSRGAVLGVARLWLRAFGDLAVSAVSEHARASRTTADSLTVVPSVATRALGLVGILGGAWLAAWIFPFIPWGPEWVNLRLIAFNLGAIAIVNALSRRLPASSHGALAISAAALLANGWYLAMVVFGISRPVPPEPDPGFRLVMFWAGLAMWLADMAFGAMAMRFGGIARLGALALAIGSVLGLLGMDRLGLVQGQYGAIAVPLALAGITLNGIGWILLGLDVATRRRPVPAA